ncbi:hypothetical protein CY34DRAFT_811489 [Suillus luteus UH-Slu-Lm8-n1]|uniref:Uncharacterized protein n=1 Tax=Suillus luteus UH-Slu-Lm8-n1 TaxID=930992 RepID=A0A0D0A392_9AGAM|nr:hypothetical protein CY34DRAFT_811489 [Suillus luteus UH-Slu-Lm8-n1]
MIIPCLSQANSTLQRVRSALSLVIPLIFISCPSGLATAVNSRSSTALLMKSHPPWKIPIPTDRDGLRDPHPHEN